MLNIFPELLYPFFAPALLRAAMAIVFFYVAYQQYQQRQNISALQLPIVGRNFVWLAIIFHAVVGAMFLLGYYTQAAAIVAILGLLAGWWLNRRHPSMIILPNSTVLLLIVVSVSLLISGAGAMAQDLPL